MSANDGGSAFPEIYTDFHANDGQHGRHDTYSAGGMTLRDYFAAKAMDAQIVSHSAGFFSNSSTFTNLAKVSYLIADAMLKERAK